MDEKICKGFVLLLCTLHLLHSIKCEREQRTSPAVKSRQKRGGILKFICSYLLMQYKTAEKNKYIILRQSIYTTWLTNFAHDHS